MSQSKGLKPLVRDDNSKDSYKKSVRGSRLRAQTNICGKEVSTNAWRMLL
jgi:hypothetical protein